MLGLWDLWLVRVVMIPVFKNGRLLLMVALLGIWLLLLVLGLGLLLLVLGLGGFLLGLGLGLLLLGLGLGLLDLWLGLLDLWLGLTEGVLQLGIVDHLLILVGLGVDLPLLGSCARASGGGWGGSRSPSALGTRGLPVIFAGSAICLIWGLSYMTLQLGRGAWVKVLLEVLLEVLLLGGSMAGGSAPNLKALNSFASVAGDEV